MPPNNNLREIELWDSAVSAESSILELLTYSVYKQREIDAIRTRCSNSNVTEVKAIKDYRQYHSIDTIKTTYESEARLRLARYVLEVERDVANREHKVTLDKLNRLETTVNKLKHPGFWSRVGQGVVITLVTTLLLLSGSLLFNISWQEVLGLDKDTPPKQKNQTPRLPNKHFNEPPTPLGSERSGDSPKGFSPYSRLAPVWLFQQQRA